MKAANRTLASTTDRADLAPHRTHAPPAVPDVKLVGALTAGLKLLRHLARNDTPAGVSQLARDLGLNASTCFNLLKTLVHEGLVEFDSVGKTYRIGVGLVEMARGALDQSSYLRIVRPHIEAIAARHGVTASLWQRSGSDRVVMLDRADINSPITLHMSIGQRLPLYVAALGRCMAAHAGLSQAELRRRFDALRWQDPLPFETYWEEVEQARRRGYAVDVGRFVRGVTTASAAVLDEQGVALLAISAVGFSAQFRAGELKALCEDLRNRARQISQSIAGGARQGATRARTHS